MDKQIILYDIGDFNGISCMEDFYEKIGFTFKTIKDVSNFSMNKTNCEKLLDFIKLNAKNDKKHKHLNALTTRAYNNACIVNWIGFSPRANDEIPANEIWVDQEEMK